MAVQKTETIAVVGAGLMGRGIVEVAACVGYKVLWNDLKPEFVRRGLKEIEKSLDRRVEKAKITAADRQRIQDHLSASVSVAEELGRAVEADWVIEAITENLEQKRRLHASLGDVCRESTRRASDISDVA